MPAPTVPSTIACAPSRLLAEACEAIASQHAADNPDFSRITVLLPQLHARAAFARALQKAAGKRAVLLPRITTLRAWAGQMAAGPAMPPAAREALIYQALAERRWFPQADLWAVAAELAGLFDELTRWRVGLPGSLEDFTRRLEQAYRASAGASFQLEARLVHELWHALAGGSGRIDAEAAYQLGLTRIAKELSDPLYAVGLARLTPAEAEFLQQCARRVSVLRFVSDQNPAATAPPADRILAQAWPAAAGVSLRERAGALRASGMPDTLRGHVRFFGADGPEEEARAIDVSVRQWLLEGRQSVAVVVLDRLVARRARALLERAEVLVRDESGWALSTTSAATVIGRWFDCLGNDFYYRDLLDLLKSPFALCDWPRSARRQAVWRLERSLRKANVRARLEGYLRLAEGSGDLELRQLLRRVQRGVSVLDPDRRKTLPSWLGALQSSLDAIGVTAGLQADAAGIEVLELLGALARDLADQTLTVEFAELRRWLARHLEAATFRDAGIESPVLFTSLEASRLRSFDAVLVAGADSSQLPGNDAAGLFFNQTVRRDLGLPGPTERVRDLEDALAGLIGGSREVLVTWQRMRDGEANLLSPLFERLRTVHKLAWDDALDDRALAVRIGAVQPATDPAPDPLPTVRPAPSAPPERVPQAISASGYNALMACPYQFHARYVLGLRETDEVQEALDKSDYGTRVHEILRRFHDVHPRLSEMAPAAAQRELEQLSASVFEGAIADDYLASAWLARWRKIIPRYVDWQRRREVEGWEVHASEAERAVELVTPSGRRFTLRGRIDRIDRHPDGSVAVIDYKTRSQPGLTRSLEAPGEDVQLPVYALLWGGSVSLAEFLALDGKNVDSVALDGDVDTLAAAVKDRLTHLFDRMADGAPLPAQGIDAVCQYCEMAGLCRRAHWP